MKFVRTIFDKLRPHFSGKGKLERLYPLFEATENFFLSSNEATVNGSHIRDKNDLKRMMIMVIFALTPCTLFGIWNAGHQMLLKHSTTTSFLNEFIHGLYIVLPIIAVSYIVGGLWEVFFAIVRRHEINEGFLVTGLLFPLTLPPTIPLWQVALGISFGVVIGKELFGGTGHNVINPALSGRAFLFFAYPAYMSGDIWVSEAVLGTSGPIDATVSATPLADGTVYSSVDAFLGLIPGSIGEMCVPAILFGALILLSLKVASWRIMLSCLIGFLISLVTFGVASSDIVLNLVSGGFLFGLVFMATDPVSAPLSIKMHWIYGFLIGALTVVIRLFNVAFTEGMMLAIIFMNFISPLLDYVYMQVHIRRRRR